MHFIGAVGHRWWWWLRSNEKGAAVDEGKGIESRRSNDCRTSARNAGLKHMTVIMKRERESMVAVVKCGYKVTCISGCSWRQGMQHQ